MSKKTFKLIKTTLYRDVDLTSEHGTYDIKIFPLNKGNVKGIVINPFNDTFGMSKQSNKNNVNKIFTEHKNGKSRYTYSIVVNGNTTYFELTDNLLELTI